MPNRVLIAGHSQVETVGRGSHILTSRVGSDGKSFGWSGTGLVASVVGWVVVGLVDDFRASKYGVFSV
jgi:hypothetical protein